MVVGRFTPHFEKIERVVLIIITLSKSHKGKAR